LNRGDAVGVLLHDPRRQVILLCEQFRLPTYDHGLGWLLEIPAGILEPHEDPDACARRETLEETGQTVTTLDRIATGYPSPGGSSERIHIFHAEIAIRDDVPDMTGNASEDEYIRVLPMPVSQALASAREGQIVDAKTLIALQWLALRS